MITRRHFMKTLVAALAACLGGSVYARFVEPRWLRSVYSIVPVPGTILAGEPLRVLHLSDFHASHTVPLSFIDKAVTLGLAQKPDLVCITGDFYNRSVPRPDVYTRILRRLSNAAPVFACPGNHDGGAWAERHRGHKDLAAFYSLLEDGGIEPLVNCSTVLGIRDVRVQLTGLGDLWADDARPESAFAGVTPDSYDLSVLLSHNPDSKAILEAYPWYLMLCGHTHGGQLDLPLFGTPLAPVEDHRFVHGLRPWKGRWIHVSRGVGNLHGVRFNCRPEINFLDLTSAL